MLARAASGHGGKSHETDKPLTEAEYKKSSSSYGDDKAQLPTMDMYPIANKSYQQHYNRQQTKFNLWLAASAASFSIAAFLVSKISLYFARLIDIIFKDVVLG